MKKLLNILTISTLTASVPAPLLANTLLTRAKRDVGITVKDITTGFDVSVISILNKWNKVDNNRENEFSKPNNKWYFYVRVIDKYICEKLYFDSNFIKNQNTYWQHLKYGINFPVYRWDGAGEPATPIINKNTSEITDWNLKIKDNSLFQQGISFALVDGSKTATWSNAGMRLTVDGETNINIDNKNVTDVYWDGAKQNMLDHKVNINVKPETSEKTHKLVIKYDINGTKYTSEDIDVVMAAKIEPSKPIVKENLSDVIKFDNNNDLGNILDNNDDTIKAKIIENNSLDIDFSQITIEKKDDHSATLSAIEGSKSYQGSVDVKYNVVPSTTVDLNIDLTSSASGVQIDKDYLAQLDSSKMTNKVNTFYYANGKSVIKIKQPSTGNVITGVVYGCDDKWNKTSQSNVIDPISGLDIDKGQYGSVDGRYLIELQHKDLRTHIKTIYLQVSEQQKVAHYWNTPNGKNFEQWADDNEYKNIRGSSASQLNNLFELSQTWKQSLAHLDLKLDNFFVDNIKNVSQDEIETYKTTTLASVKAQVEKYAPGVVEKSDYVISVDNLVAGDWTTNKDVKVQSVDGSTKLLSFTTKTIPVQQKEQPIPPTPNPEPTPDNNKKGGDSKLWIIGVVVGVLAGLGLAYLLFKRFVFDKYFLPKIKKRRHDKLVEKVRKEEAEKEASEQAQENRELDDEQNNKGSEK